jgi:adenylate cyclase
MSSEGRIQRKLTAVLVADVAGYARLVNQDEAGAIERLAWLREREILPVIEAHRGRLVKTMGDGLLVEFASVVDGLEAAVAIQAAVAAVETPRPQNQQIALRVGLNLGDVIVDGDDILGDGVNVAARLEELADVGGILMAANVADQVRGKVDVTLEPMGELTLKNISSPVTGFRVAPVVVPALGTVEMPLAQTETPSVAVLPFTTASGSADRELFADGMVGDIIANLSCHTGLFVISWNSSSIYDGDNLDIASAARDLGVRYVVTGSIQQSQDRVRVSARLADAASGGHLWAEKFDRKLEAVADLFDVEDEIAGRIVSALTPELVQAESSRIRARSIHDLDARSLMIQARAAIWSWSLVGMAEAETVAREVVRRAPESGEALAMLSLARWGQAISGFVADGEAAVTEAYQLSVDAVALEPGSAIARLMMGLNLMHSRRFAEAEEEVGHAIDIQPGSSEVLCLAAYPYVYGGNPEAGIEMSRLSIRLNPRDPHIYGRYQAIATAEFALGRYDEAATNALRVVRMLPEWSEARTIAIASFVELGRLEEARDIWRQEAARNPRYVPEYVRRRHPFQDTAITDRLVAAVAAAEAADGSS